MTKLSKAQADLISCSWALVVTGILVSMNPSQFAKAARDCAHSIQSLDNPRPVIFLVKPNVPLQGLTVGLSPILAARHALLLALGEHKCSIVRETLEGPVTDRVPASYLQEHADARVLLDFPAAGSLTGVSMPWLLDKVSWDEALIKRAVLWLCEQTGKALLKLDDEDFRQHDLHQLLRHHGPAQKIAHHVFRWMQDTIVYHPAGKESKVALCFSPHPDDDVISMGGTLIRLVEDGHRVHVAYMTSGNIAVFDHDARRVADMVTEYNRLFGIDQQKSARSTTAGPRWSMQKGTRST